MKPSVMALSALLIAAPAFSQAPVQALIPVSSVRVVDGDTFQAVALVWPRVSVEVGVRLAGIDAPEINGKCVAEKELAKKAKARLEQILSYGDVRVTVLHEDKYAARVDAVVSAKGVDPATILLQEGLAKPYTGSGPRPAWCQ